MRLPPMIAGPLHDDKIVRVVPAGESPPERLNEAIAKVRAERREHDGVCARLLAEAGSTLAHNAPATWAQYVEWALVPAVACVVLVVWEIFAFTFPAW
ncbi:MAG TPA: hypothetical protein VFC53_09970 [Dehalococcoidia bacterium]|nr:hypothetical protein [Dehalococcoidia bacterium]